MNEFKGTPGPWRWELNLSTKHLNLCGGKNPYDLTVMDFVRWGMGGAMPRFNVDYGSGMQLMEKSERMGAIVKGREHHARWFQDINHPDARLIAAAPDLLECLNAFIKSTYVGCSKEELNNLRLNAESAVNKALGQ